MTKAYDELQATILSDEYSYYMQEAIKILDKFKASCPYDIGSKVVITSDEQAYNGVTGIVTSLHANRYVPTFGSGGMSINGEAILSLNAENELIWVVTVEITTAYGELHDHKSVIQIYDSPFRNALKLVSPVKP